MLPRDLKYSRVLWHFTTSSLKSLSSSFLASPCKGNSTWNVMSDIKLQECPQQFSSSVILQSQRKMDKQIFHFVSLLLWGQQLNLIIHRAKHQNRWSKEERVAWEKEPPGSIRWTVESPRPGLQALSLSLWVLRSLFNFLSFSFLLCQLRNFVVWIRVDGMWGGTLLVPGIQ